MSYLLWVAAAAVAAAKVTFALKYRGSSLWAPPSTAARTQGSLTKALVPATSNTTRSTSKQDEKL
eukprot:1157041-Pelagomonas_calceolata.AAC.5